MTVSRIARSELEEVRALAAPPQAVRRAALVLYVVLASAAPGGHASPVCKENFPQMQKLAIIFSRFQSKCEKSLTALALQF